MSDRNAKSLLVIFHFALVACSVPYQHSNRVLSETAQGFFQTPDGVFPSSCVYNVGNGSSVDSNGLVTYSDGTYSQMPKCTMLPRSQSPILSAPDYAPPDSWVMDSIAQSATPVVRMVSTFVVPNPPKFQDGQLDYFFPGLRPMDGSCVLQPVLQWEDGEWQAASWSCAAVSGGPCPNSSMISVNTGDELYGEIVGTNCTNLGQCNWAITTTDKTNGQTTTLNTTNDDRVYELLFGGVLEAYGVRQCADYPSNGSITFTGVDFYDAQGKIMTPEWFPQYDITTYCKLSINTTNDSTVLDFEDTSASDN